MTYILRIGNKEVVRERAYGAVRKVACDDGLLCYEHGAQLALLNGVPICWPCFVLKHAAYLPRRA